MLNLKISLLEHGEIVTALVRKNLDYIMTDAIRAYKGNTHAATEPDEVRTQVLATKNQTVQLYVYQSTILKIDR